MDCSAPDGGPLVKRRETVSTSTGWDPEWSPARNLASFPGWQRWFPRLSTRRYDDGSDNFFAEGVARLGPDSVRALAALAADGWHLSVFPSRDGRTLVVHIEETE